MLKNPVNLGTGTDITKDNLLSNYGRQYSTKMPGIDDVIVKHLHGSRIVQDNRAKYIFIFSEEDAIYHNNLALYRVAIINSVGTTVGLIEKRLVMMNTHEVSLRTKESDFMSTTELTLGFSEYFSNTFGDISEGIAKSMEESLKRVIEFLAPEVHLPKFYIPRHNKREI